MLQNVALIFLRANIKRLLYAFKGFRIKRPRFGDCALHLEWGKNRNLSQCLIDRIVDSSSEAIHEKVPKYVDHDGPIPLEPC